jgi:AraC family transcriptional regulator of adaptative response / DNA-3-methyladenine glycosylase II
MPGIGPWTADYVRMRVLGDPDVLLPGDVAARAGADASGIPSDAGPLTAWATRVAPWRSYLTAHLWRAAPVKAVRKGRGAPGAVDASPSALAPKTAPTISITEGTK